MIKTTTQTIANDYGTYHNSPQAFFNSFSHAWNEVRFTIFKIETRQEYREPENQSYQAWMNQEYEKSRLLLAESRACDIELYSSLAKRSVDFIRCRPLVLPPSPYLQWELEIYAINAAYGEHIYVTQDLTLFQTITLNDFIVFDQNFACIHNYNQLGELQGGWTINSPTNTMELANIAREIKAQCIPLEELNF